MRLNSQATGHEAMLQAKIGPNALTQTVRALRETCDETQVAALLGQCDQEYLLRETIKEMVDEQAFAALVAVLADQLGVSQAQHVLWRSGRLTAAYLLQHRIPRPFQWLLRPLPYRPALMLLLLAISKHAWTFVGSGSFHYHVGETSWLTVATHLCPAEAICGFYGGTFAHLIRTLIDPQARLDMVVSMQYGQANCVYSVRFSDFGF